MKKYLEESSISTLGSLKDFIVAYSVTILLHLERVLNIQIITDNCLIIIMRRSIQNFNIPPPRAYPGHLTVHRALGGGNLNVSLEGWGI